MNFIRAEWWSQIPDTKLNSVEIKKINCCNDFDQEKHSEKTHSNWSCLYRSGFRLSWQWDPDQVPVFSTGKYQIILPKGLDPDPVKLRQDPYPVQLGPDPVKLGSDPQLCHLQAENCVFCSIHFQLDTVHWTRFSLNLQKCNLFVRTKMEISWAKPLKKTKLLHNCHWNFFFF